LRKINAFEGADVSPLDRVLGLSKSDSFKEIHLIISS
jgi:hypothetical protein